MWYILTDNRPEQRIQNKFVWFREWVIERQTYKTLSRDSGLSRDTLQRTFYHLLEKAPRIKIIKRQGVHFRIDATYFARFCVVCYQDNHDGYTQLIRFTDGEHYEEIREDLANLIKLGIQIESITSDGHKSALKAIKKSVPDATQAALFGSYSAHVPVVAYPVSKTRGRPGAAPSGAFDP